MFTKADHLLAEFAAAHHSVFTNEHARDFGLTHAQIDHRVLNSWTHLSDGVYRSVVTAQTGLGAYSQERAVFVGPFRVSASDAAPSRGRQAPRRSRVESPSH